MNKNINTVKMIQFLLCGICFFTFINQTSAENLNLIGFEKMVQDFNQRRSNLLYKLEGKTYHLRINQTGNYSLTLTPAELFQVDKVDGNQFKATVMNPRSLWKKHKKKPFKISWEIEEIVEY